MIKHLLPVVPKYFKANLHTHSTLSDGQFTPAEVKDLYKAQGYSILAITDHNVIADHSALNEPDFLMLTGVESNIANDNYRETKGFEGKLAHFNLLAKRPDHLWQPCSTPVKRTNCKPYSDWVTSDNMPQVHDAEHINAIIARCNEMGFLVTYNHPLWSGHNYKDYKDLKGFWALELANYSSITGGLDEHNAHVYRDLLALGNRLYTVAADDMHTTKALAGAWIMVGAKTLEYGEVIRALEAGEFYSSLGPQIYSLTVENGVLKVTCSDAKYINVETHARPARRFVAEEGEALNFAEYDLQSWIEKSAGNPNAYIRVTVTAADGKYAATRAYWLDEIAE